jgi:hypothetical protein
MDYIYIRAWGEHVGEQSRVINDLLTTAHEDKAPGNAIYKDEDGTWATINDVNHKVTRTQIERIAERLMRRENPRHPDLPPRRIM